MPRPLLIVRLILGISLLLLGSGLLLCRVEETSGNGVVVPAAARWVRTIDGWERPGMWRETTDFVPRLHPLVVAAGQGLLSVFGLLACRRNVPGVRVACNS